jgi:hypothetical protein
MKNLIIFSVMLLIIACSATRVNRSSLNDRDITSFYKIKKIKFDKSVYTIYAVRNDSTFKIISYSNNTVVSNCERIKVGNEYLLELKKIFPSDSLLGKPVAPNLGIKRYVLNNSKSVILEKESHNKIYTALNLNGLCIRDRVLYQ